MEAFTLAFNPSARPAALFPPRSFRVLLLFGAPALAGFALFKLGWVSQVILGIGGIVLLHGGLLAWALLHPFGWSRAWGRLVVTALGVLLLGGLAAEWNQWGGWMWGLLPLWIVILGRRIPDLHRLGLRPPYKFWMLPAGVGVGGFLGLHVLVTGSRMMRYRVAISPVGPWIAALAYDLGVNVVTAELLFRGAFFTAWWRRWGFWPAAILSTALSLLRYLVDPRLPKDWDVLAGASFYLLLLGLAGCALVRLSGSLFPSGLAALVFFACYRALRLP